MGRAQAVICPSESARDDLVQHLRLTPSRLHVVPETPAPVFQPVSATQRETILGRLKLPETFVLAVGGIEPRKNPAAILSALSVIKGTGHKVNVVFAGHRGLDFDLSAEASARGVSELVCALGVVPDEVLVALYAAAIALVFPSHYEGFGLPVVEAFACGAPVVASTAGSLPEVGGDAALYADPSDPEALAAAISRLCWSPGSPKTSPLAGTSGSRKLVQVVSCVGVEQVEGGLVSDALQGHAAAGLPAFDPGH